MNGNLVYNCGTLFTLTEMVKINKGVTLIPRLALAKNELIKKENIFSLTEPVPVREIGLIVHKNFVKKRILKFLSEVIITVTAPYFSDQSKSKIVINPFDNS